MAKELAYVCEDLKRQIKFQLKGFIESWEPRFYKGTHDIKNSINFISEAYYETKEQLGNILNENKEL